MSTLALNSRLGAALALCRVSNLPTVWMNVLTAAFLSDPAGSAPYAAPVLLLAFSLSCFYCGGMAQNDLYDLDHDRVHQPFRPIAVGAIALGAARALTLASFAMGFACLLLAPHRAGAYAAVALVIVIWTYNRFHKRHPSTMFAMAGARLLVYIVTALALTGRVSARVEVAALAQASYVLALTAVARAERHTAAQRYRWPVVPWMLAAMPMVDGVVLAVLFTPVWLFVGAAGSALARAGQRRIRGD
ncbi:prenyltransferase [Trinickia dabaoshanensis]|uniref:Prenyltransferase n=1 Tax=Trinickia dabaoshanensis TaxID=564714 RepID=A0A2N7VIP0_9BURK|nr:UbiA family prenyltransferase [Trinickia dabaoshanensis]PMS17008.1 prenyltransferase [Trinickia dabaoshanensis]